MGADGVGIWSAGIRGLTTDAIPPAVGRSANCYKSCAIPNVR